MRIGRALVAVVLRICDDPFRRRAVCVARSLAHLQSHLQVYLQKHWYKQSHSNDDKHSNLAKSNSRALARSSFDSSIVAGLSQARLR